MWNLYINPSGSIYLYLKFYCKLYISYSWRKLNSRCKWIHILGDPVGCIVSYSSYIIEFQTIYLWTIETRNSKWWQSEVLVGICWILNLIKVSWIGLGYCWISCWCSTCNCKSAITCCNCICRNRCSLDSKFVNFKLVYKRAKFYFTTWNNRNWIHFGMITRSGRIIN